MKKRLFLFLCPTALWPALGAMAASVVGVVVNGNSGSPLSGATVMLRDQNSQALTNFNGQFRINASDG